MVQHEYIKRSDVGCFLFLSCGLSNFMGDAMRGDYFFLGWICGMLTCFFILRGTGAI
jgi:hypothetical protein